LQLSRAIDCNHAAREPPPSLSRRSASKPPWLERQFEVETDNIARNIQLVITSNGIETFAARSYDDEVRYNVPLERFSVPMFDRTSDYLSPFKVLVIEPNPLMRRITCGILRLLGARKVIEVDGITTALPFIRQGDIDFILSEWYLAGSYGVDLVRYIRQERPEIAFTPFIMITSQTRLESVTTARNAGITEFVAKPFSAKSLVARIREVIERPRPFVSIGKYFGPDRRRRALVLEEKTERRNHGEILMAGNDLTQAQINNIVAGSGRR